MKCLDEKQLEQRNREADDAWNEYQTTGQSVSHKDMDIWLATWGTEKEMQCLINQKLS